MHEGAAVNRIVGHLLARFLSAGLAGIGRHQADGFHFVGPLFVVVAASARLAEMELPSVRHFVNQSLQYFEQRHDTKIGWIHGDFVGHGLFVPVGEPARREIAIGALFALHRDETVRELTIEQSGVVVLKRCL